jgi:hypothetical protein
LAADLAHDVGRVKDDDISSSGMGDLAAQTKNTGTGAVLFRSLVSY